MQADDYIRLHSLHSAKEHNGKTGRLVAFDPDAGRWQVALADGGRLNVKPANLELVAAEKAPTRTQICFGSGASSAEAPLVDEAPPPWYDEHLDDEFVDSGIFDETFCYILKQMDLDVCHPDSPIAQLFGDGLAKSRRRNEEVRELINSIENLCCCQCWWTGQENCRPQSKSYRPS